MKLNHFILLCMLLPITSFAQSWRIGLNGGLSQTFMNVEWQHRKEPLQTWNANLEVTRRTKKHFEYGAAINLQPLANNITLYSEDDFNPITGFLIGSGKQYRYYLADPSISLSLLGGYFLEKGKHSGSVGVGAGYTYAPETNGSKYSGNEITIGAQGHGLVASVYLRYAFALSRHFEATAGVQPRWYQLSYPGLKLPGAESMSGYCVPGSLGIIYKF